jgi:4-amino-4-deoxy-L-arabinose transferase-like glycosyltransferase
MVERIVDEHTRAGDPAARAAEASRWRFSVQAFRSHLHAAERWVTGGREGKVLVLALAAFATLWATYHIVSSATLDVDSDVSDISLWVRDFGFGYHHPPLQPWIFGLWFSVFPRAAWAVKLLATSLAVSTLVIAWRIARDVLDRERALLGTLSLMLVPLTTFLALTLDANTVAMPFWAAAQLFYLRARRGLRISDAALSGTCAALAFLGKFWAIYLVAGMAAASFTGASARRFWLSAAPYVMAGSAIAVLALWLAIAQGGAALAFASEVQGGEAFSAALTRSAAYLTGSLAYVAVPILLAVSLRPSRQALTDMLWPADEGRRQVLVLLAVPLILPALANLAFPHRLTALWTIPNWALLPVVLFGSPLLTIKAPAIVRTGLLALAVALVAIIASPVIALYTLQKPAEQNRTHFRQVAAAAEGLAGGPVKLLWGSRNIAGGLPFYLPGARLLNDDPVSAKARAEIRQSGLVVTCLDTDAACRAALAALAHPGDPEIEFSATRTFLGFAGPPKTYRLMLARPESGD